MFILKSGEVKAVTPGRIKAARIVAISADFLQIVAFPFFGEGFLSPLNDALDAVVGLTLILLVGWHYAFLPTFLVEMLPVGDVIPTWTMAVLLVTRQKPAVPAESASAGQSSVTVDAPPASPTGEQGAQKLLPSAIESKLPPESPASSKAEHTG